MNWDTLFSTRLHVRPAKTQISLCKRSIFEDLDDQTERLHGLLCGYPKIQYFFRRTAKTDEADPSLCWAHMKIVGNAVPRLIFL